MAQLIESVDVTIDLWHAQHAIYKTRGRGVDDLALGFATFFLNRTNRSGILTARPIGGLQQTGAWKMDARFNRSGLARRVRTLGHYRNRVTLAEEDGVDLVKRFRGPKHFIYADPPYLVRGSDLYLDTLAWSDHQKLARLLSGSSARWMVTYDHDSRVHELYPAERRAVFSIAHTAAKPHVGEELAVFGDAVEVSELAGLGRAAAFV